MDDQSAGDLQPDLTEVVDATAEAQFHSASHVRDREARVAELAPCVHARIDWCEPVRVTVSRLAFTLRIPDIAAATITEVPDDRWYGWQWSPEEFLLLHVDPAQEFAIGHPNAASCRLSIAGRSMEARRIAPGDPGWAANVYSAEITGFLDDTRLFWGQVVSPTESRRELLLAAVATLERVSE